MRSPQLSVVDPTGRAERYDSVARHSRCCTLGAARRMTLIVPATPPNSALGPLMISMRSMSPGDSCSSEKPGGAGSPFSRICV